MQRVDQAIHARWVIPVEPDSNVLDYHSVLIDGERIAGIVPTLRCRQEFDIGKEIECSNHAVIPGLINTHTHAAMSLFRGLADDLPLKRWLEDHIWPAEAAWAGREFVRDGTRLAAAEMLRGGTTCFNDMYFFPDEAAAASIEAGIRSMVGMIVFGTPSAWAGSIDEYFTNGQRVHDQYRSHPRIHTAFAPHAPYTVNDDALARVATLAEELDVPIHMHVHETSEEVAQARKDRGEDPLTRLARLGLLSERLIAVHMTCVEPDEIDRLAIAGVNVAHCPESNMKLASGLCPVTKLLDAGINVAIGTDGAASNNDLDMLSEMRTAALLAKAVSKDPCAVPASTVLRMATRGAARALGLEAEIGSLTVGKQADIVVIDLGDPRSQPVYDPVSQIVYCAHRDQVSEVWVAGRHVVKAGKLQSLDQHELLLMAQRWQARISARAHHAGVALRPD